MEETIWYPGDIFSRHLVQHKRYALLVLNQDLKLPFRIYHRIWRNSLYHVAVDGGANHVYDLNISSKVEDNPDEYLSLDTIIGDLDSFRKELRQEYLDKGVEIIMDPEQNSTDFTKAVRYIKTCELSTTGSRMVSQSSGHTSLQTQRSRLTNIKGLSRPLDIVCLGGLGGRVDQGLSQLHHLYTFQKAPNYAEGRMFLVSSEAITFVLRAGRHRIKVLENLGSIRLGEHIGIIPLKEPSVITTSGLKWDVEDWETEFGGHISTSNMVREEWITVETTRDVLFTIDLAVGSDRVEG
ncbi:hypothetical protein B7494_g6844 [Chlorociboria aeruginascens]|nr:hypothetical protein B7494_g6844 [Chlorociboria aeruginascens]